MNAGPPDLESLATAAGAGDRGAFATLARAVAPRLHRLAWGILGDADLAADAVQETLIKLASALKKYDPRRPFWPWLRRIAARAAIDLQRREKRLHALPLEVAVERPGPDSDRPDVRHEAGEARALLARFLESLPRQQRAVLWMRDQIGMSTDAVAEALDMSASTVRVHLARARCKLREAFALHTDREVRP